MSDLGQSFRVPAVRFPRRVLPGPVERVWAHLTDAESLSGWYGDESRIEPREGGMVSLMGGHIRGVVTQWVPNRKFAHTWNVFDGDAAESPYPESYLAFELEPRGDEVALILLHLPVLERFEAQNKMGWHTFLDIFAAALSGQLAEPRAAYMARNAELYGVDLANLQR